MQQTSLMAWKTSTFSPDCQTLYNVMRAYCKKYGDVTDTKAALALGWEKARVSARRNDLIRTGHVRESRIRPSYVGDSNRQHRAWMVI